MAFAGEVGLTGEIRSVSNIQGRINECSKFGVETLYANNKHEKSKNIKLVNVKNINDLLKL